MAYPITIVDGRPQLDSLPVGKIVNYPLEKRDYRPFAQFRLCVNEEGLHLYLWAFELEVSPKSVMRVCLNLCPGQRKHLDLALFAMALPAFPSGRGTGFWRSSGGGPPFVGEDLQWV